MVPAGADYRGPRNTTASGRPCVPWAFALALPAHRPLYTANMAMAALAGLMGPQLRDFDDETYEWEYSCCFQKCKGEATLEVKGPATFSWTNVSGSFVPGASLRLSTAMFHAAAFVHRLSSARGFRSPFWDP